MSAIDFKLIPKKIGKFENGKLNDLTSVFFRINLKSMADMSHDMAQFKNVGGHEP